MLIAFDGFGLVVAGVFLVMSLGVSIAIGAETDRQPLLEVRGEIASTQQQREALMAIRDRLNQQLSEIELEQGQMARTIGELEAQSRARDKRTKGLQQRRDQLQVSVREQQKTLAGQLRSAHLIGREDWLKLLLNQEEPSHLARVLAYYGYLGRARSELIGKLEEDLEQVRMTEAELQIEAEQKALLGRKTQKERTALLESGRQRRQLLKSWDRELHAKAQRLNQLKDDEKQLERLIDAVKDQTNKAAMTENVPEGAPLAAIKKAHCPPAGPVVARFGSPRMTGQWDGLLIGGKEGTPIRSVAAGTVVFADWLRGYGLLTIIDHGSGVMSLYAFNQTHFKQKGEAVAADQVIATLGSSGGRDKPGLYFGVRRQGKPVDPLLWCQEAH
ncbi:MAG: murein hydrolase activator EnvC family protein [Methylococcaceae bacterium]